MVAQTKADIVVLKLKYDPLLDTPVKKFTIRKESFSLKGTFSRVKNWFNPIIEAEVIKVGPNIEISFSEWEITSPNPDLFVINAIRYDKVYLILGQEKVHWIFYCHHYDQKCVPGSGDLSFSFCGCCLDKQYLEIIQQIQTTFGEQPVVEQFNN